MANQEEAKFLARAHLAWGRAKQALDPGERTTWREIAEFYEFLAELAVTNPHAQRYVGGLRGTGKQVDEVHC